MDMIAWIERRTRGVMRYYGVSWEEASAAAIEDWEWRNA